MDGLGSGLLHVPFVLIGGVLAGLVADALTEATAVAADATREALRSKTNWFPRC